MILRAVAVAIAAVCMAAFTPRRSGPIVQTRDPSAVVSRGSDRAAHALDARGPTAVIRGATLQPRPPLPACTAHIGRRYVSTQTSACSAHVHQTVRGWEPDVLVALGGGVLASGDPGCATMQRAIATHDLFERLDRRPTIVLTGRGPMRRTATLDDALVACANRRASQSRGRWAQLPWDDAANDGPIARAGSTTPRNVALTEADHMCAVILRQYPLADRTAVLDRMRFEPTATSTIENATRTVPILREIHPRRILLVTTYAFWPSGSVENHAFRALSEFRAARPGSGHYRIGSVVCPYRGAGSTWFHLP